MFAVGVFVCLAFSTIVRAQQPRVLGRYTPPELQASDPEIRELLTTAQSNSEAGGYEGAFADSKAALDLAKKKGLVGDRAIAEESVASGYFSVGKVNEALRLYQDCLQDASDASNSVLQADALVALSALPQLQGNLPGALELLTKAEGFADQSKNLYIKARVLGELGRLRIASGQVEEGVKSIEEASNIDRVNDYDLEPLHLVYAVYASLSLPKPDLTAAVKRLESARDLAIEKSNYLALVQAENTLGAIYVHTGDVENGIATFEAILKGNILKDGQTVQTGETLRSAVKLPLLKATILEALGNSYDAVHKSDEALQTWKELYSLSIDSGFTLMLAESASRAASIYESKNDVSDALNYYGVATQQWRLVQNNLQLSANLVSEALLLIRSGKGEAAIPLETEAAEIAQKTQNRVALFTAYGVLAEIYQPLKKFQQARTVLEKATALITPGPADSEIGSNAVFEDYAFLADDYRALELPIEELVALEKAVAVIRNLKDAQSAQQLQQLLAYEKGRIDALQIQQRAAKAVTEGKLAESLWYSEILYVWNGVGADPTKDENWSRVLNLPFQIAKEPGGPEALEEILDETGSLIGIGGLPILDSLSGHFLTMEPKPALAEKYAIEAESVVRGAPNPSDVLMVTPACHLAIAYANERKPDLAKQKLDECMTLAGTANDRQSRDLANSANVLVHLWGNDLGAAEDSLKYLLANAPDNPDIHLDLAIALVTKNQYDDGMKEFNQAIKQIGEKNDINAEAAAFLQMAFALSANPQYRDQELEYLKSAEKNYKQANSASGTATVEIRLGSFYQNRGDYKAALAYFQQAEALGQAGRNLRVAALAATNEGNVANSLGDHRGAEKDHRRAATTYHETGDSNGEALLLAAIAEDLQMGKDFDSALKVSLEAETIASNSSTPITRYWIQKSLAQLYYREGEFDKALKAAQEAAQFAAEAGDQQQSADAYIVWAGFCEIVGQWEDAETAANKALQIFDALKNTQGMASSYAELATIYGSRGSSLRNFDKAISFNSEATKLGANLQSVLVEIDSQAGRFPEAVDAAKSAVQVCVRNHNTECEASALADLAEVERKKGDLQASASSLKEAKRLGAGIKDVYFQGSLLYREAGQLRAEGKLDQALNAYQHLVSLLDRLKGQGDINSQRSLSENYGYIYDELSSTIYALSEGKSEPDKTRLASLALQYTEDNKAREFASTWGRTFVTELRRTLPSDLQEKERSLLSERDRLLAVSEGGEPKSKLNSIEKELDAFIKNLRLTHPQYAAIAYPQPVALSDIPLRKDETLVECKVTDESTLVWIARNVTGDRVELLDFYQVAKSRQWFDERVSKLRTTLNSARPDNIDWQNSEELFNILFPVPASKILLESRNIIFIPDDVLSVIPFELLSPDASKGQFPLLSVPTTYYPSAATLRLARTAKPVANWQEAFLGIGDPITSPEDVRYEVASVTAIKGHTPSEAAPNTAGADHYAPNLERIKSRGFSFERLPGTATEVQEIAALFKNQGQTVEIRLGSDATKGRVEDTDLTKFRFLHFATHGILPVDSNIKEPALILSYDGSAPEHMLLSMSEILGMRINSETVVLSACNTGSGTVSRAEGVMSLGRAFMAAGAQSVTVSLWQVSDNSTQTLMEQYYKNILDGRSKREALAQARSYLFKNGLSNPFFWAPFVLVGD